GSGRGFRCIRNEPASWRFKSARWPGQNTARRSESSDRSAPDPAARPAALLAGAPAVTISAVGATGEGNRKPMPLDDLLARIRACRRCEAHLPLGPRPVLVARPSARILVVGQAPGTKVHENGIPWNDRSRDRLRR